VNKSQKSNIRRYGVQHKITI